VLHAELLPTLLPAVLPTALLRRLLPLTRALAATELRTRPPLGKSCRGAGECIFAIRMGRPAVAIGIDVFRLAVMPRRNVAGRWRRCNCNSYSVIHSAKFAKYLFCFCN
jgi:hypothetical protein